MLLIVPSLMEGVQSRRLHVGLRSRVIIYTRTCAILQPCPYIRVNPAALGAMEEGAQGMHKVPGK